MDPVFIDTSGYIALWNRHDQWHAAARSAYGPLVAARRRFVTTSLVFLECGNTVARTSLRALLTATRREMSTSGNLIVPTEADIDDAWAAFDLGPPGTPGIVDHVSFLVMKRLNIRDAFTTDSHFAEAGFNVLITTQS